LLLQLFRHLLQLANIGKTAVAFQKKGIHVWAVCEELCDVVYLPFIDVCRVGVVGVGEEEAGDGVQTGAEVLCGVVHVAPACGWGEMRDTHVLTRMIDALVGSIVAPSLRAVMHVRDRAAHNVERVGEVVQHLALVHLEAQVARRTEAFVHAQEEVGGQQACLILRRRKGACGRRRRRGGRG
jgi:hypothetical protein